MEETLIESYAAYAASKRLVQMLQDEGSHSWEAVEDVMEEFMDALADEDAYIEEEAFDFVEIVGLGVLTEVLVWTMHDQSILIVGADSDDAFKIGVLPPKTQFHPIPLDDKGRPAIIH